MSVPGEGSVCLCLCGHTDVDHALGEGICRCSCPAFRPAEYDRELLSDEDWERIHGEFMNSHEPLTITKGDAFTAVLEVHFQPRPGPA